MAHHEGMKYRGLVYEGTFDIAPGTNALNVTYDPVLSKVPKLLVDSDVKLLITNETPSGFTATAPDLNGHSVHVDAVIDD